MLVNHKIKVDEKRLYVLDHPRDHHVKHLIAMIRAHVQEQIEFQNRSKNYDTENQ